MPHTLDKTIDYDREVQRAYRGLMRMLTDLPRQDRALIRRAFDFTGKAHAGIRRKSGEPYILHPLAVARIIVSEIGLRDATSIISALMHDVIEDTEIERSDIERMFGPKAAEIVDGLTKMSGPTNFDKLDSTQAENFRKILLTISDDIRVVLIKLADRLHNMRTMENMRAESMLRSTSETLYIYAPLAHRLGLYEIKSELEDLAFKFSEPKLYQEIAAKLEASKEEARAYIDSFIRRVRRVLRDSGLHFTVKSRYKTIYSIYNKMVRKNLPYEEIYDKYAIRIILETRPDMEKSDCWKVYSLLSAIFRPNPKRIRDWITVPKDNGYESLHTTLMGPDGRWVEVQIRTQRMDELAEKGIAAHWKYKESGELDDSLNDWIGQIRDILRNPDLNALEAVREFREKLEPNDVFVFSPKGEMIRLPSRATVLDFAYKIHTDVGNTAIGAKVNNQVVALDYVLRPGDQIEVLNSPKGKPRQDWLRFVKTAKARDQIRAALRKQRLEMIESGKRLYNWGTRQFNRDLAPEERQAIMNELLAYFMLPDEEDFFYALGTHRIDTTKIQEYIQLKREGREIDSEYIRDWEHKMQKQKSANGELGVKSVLIELGREHHMDNYVSAKCCNPLPGDDILAFDEEKRIVIHRTGCEKAISLMSNFSKHIIRAKWTEGRSNVEFLAGIKVSGLDKQGMLHDLIRIISLRMKLNIRKVSIESYQGGFEGLFHIYVHNSGELAQLISRIKELPNVNTVARYDGSFGEE
ncbi:MAG: RelA/SpoT family protein [Bacteroidia bacterium]